jgi:Tfp pilus assembly PilM family ATPase
MILSGGCANIENIKDLLSEQFEIPVIIGNPFKDLKIDERVFDIKRIEKLKDTLATVIGLAMRER